MITEKDILVCNFDVTPDSLIKPSSLFKYYQQAARENLDAVGLPFEKMLETGVVFVITRMKSCVYTDVCGYDRLNMKTSSREIKGAVFTRDFTLWRGDELVAEASTQWALIDINSRRLCRPSVYSEYFPEGEAICSFQGAGKLVLENEFDNVYSYRVVYSDIDENRHLNNTRYSDICLDALGGIPEGMRVGEVRIDFLAEARLGDELLVHSRLENNTAQFTAFNDNTDRVCFNAEIIFEKR